DSKVDGVKVSSARIEPNSVPGEYIYRIVLLQTGSRAKQFHGRYQLVVNLLHNGERRGMTLPGPGDSGDAPYQLDFSVHQRIDGTFRVDPGAVVRSVELACSKAGNRSPSSCRPLHCRKSASRRFVIVQGGAHVWSQAQ